MIGKRLRQAVNAGRAAVEALENADGPALGLLYVGTGSGVDGICRDAAAHAARYSGGPTILITGSRALDLYRIDGVITEYLPGVAGKGGHPAPGWSDAELYSVRRLHVLHGKWRIERLEPLDEASARWHEAAAPILNSFKPVLESAAEKK